MLSAKAANMDKMKSLGPQEADNLNPVKSKETQDN